MPYKNHSQDIEKFPNLKLWFERMWARPATIGAYEGTEESYAPSKPITDEERKILFGQGARQ